MAQYAEMLERQERRRAEQVARARALQARQAEDAAALPPYKRYLDPTLIDRQFRRVPWGAPVQPAQERGTSAAGPSAGRALPFNCCGSWIKHMVPRKQIAHWVTVLSLF